MDLYSECCSCENNNSACRLVGIRDVVLTKLYLSVYGMENNSAFGLESSQDVVLTGMMKSREERGYITTQVLIEYINVSTGSL